MGEKESHDAATEARHDAKRRQVPMAHLDAIGRYLAGVAYQTSHDADADRDENGPKHRQAGPDKDKPAQ